MANDEVYALVFAGGTGSRMEGSAVPKQFLELGGKPIIVHTLEHFEKHQQVNGIVVVCLNAWIDKLQEIIDLNHFTKILDIVPGGETGQDSIFNGLVALNRLAPNPNSVILVHDGVRPLINESTISACIDSVRQKGCTATVSPSQETVIEVHGDTTVNILDRSVCKFARAPQGFIFKDFYQAHLAAHETGLNNFTDSVSLMARFGYQIFTVDGPVDNIKITTKKDYFAFKGYMDYKELGQLWQESL